MCHTGDHQQHVAAFFDRHLVAFGGFATTVLLAIGKRITAEVMRCERESPALEAGVIEDGFQLRFQERGTEEQEKRRAWVCDVYGVDGSVAEVLFGEEERRSIDVGGELVRC